MTGSYQSVGVLGAGAWGTALALAARRAGRDVTLWARRAEVAAQLAEEGENRDYLPGVALDPAIAVSADLAAVAGAEALLLVTPAQTLRATLQALAPGLPKATPLVLCAKGIEQQSGLFMSQVAGDMLPGQPLAVLSGPNFAGEVAGGRPAATTIASNDPALAEALVRCLGSATFRPYSSSDLLGAQIGGAVKNVMAIACGVAAGRGLGENARAALITRGLAEMLRLGTKLGARPETLMGLSGLGDLTLTCTALQSRNYSLGVALGEGRTLGEILSARRSVSEGVHSAAAVVQLAQTLGLEMPICAAVDAIVNRDADLAATIQDLLARPFRAEMD